jgi:hypothetical protein
MASSGRLQKGATPPPLSFFTSRLAGRYTPDTAPVIMRYAIDYTDFERMLTPRDLATA